mmetsp:Transcript_42481/g.68904  ORF Transcript_42481/g.68904 Transcript_42481/m.68904 type:complete len:442 (+) Transcript_42481:12-1337(+)
MLPRFLPSGVGSDVARVFGRPTRKLLLSNDSSLCTSLRSPRTSPSCVTMHYFWPAEFSCTVFYRLRSIDSILRSLSLSGLHIFMITGGGGLGDGGNSGNSGERPDKPDGEEPVPWKTVYLSIPETTKKLVAYLVATLLVLTGLVDQEIGMLRKSEGVVGAFSSFVSGYVRVPLVMLIAFVIHPYLRRLARAVFIRKVTGENGGQDDVLNYSMTLLGLVYAIMLGSTYEDSNAKQDLLQQSLYREVSNLHQVVILSESLNGGKDMKANNTLLNNIHRYISCVLDKDMDRDAAVCNQCANILGDMIPAVSRIANDGSNDAVDRTIMDSILSGLRAAADARSDRMAAFTLKIPTAHLIRLRFAGTVLVGGCLLLSSEHLLLDRSLFALLTSTYVVLDAVLRDLGDWTYGDWSVGFEPYYDLQKEVERLAELTDAKLPDKKSYGF